MNLKSLLLSSAILFNNVPSNEFLFFYSSDLMVELENKYFYSYNEELDEFIDYNFNQDSYYFWCYQVSDSGNNSLYLTLLSDIQDPYEVLIEVPKVDLINYFENDYNDLTLKAQVSTELDENNITCSYICNSNDADFYYDDFLDIGSTALEPYDFTNQQFFIEFDFMQVPEFVDWLKYHVLELERPSLTDNLFTIIGTTLEEYSKLLPQTFNNLIEVFYVDNKLTGAGILVLIGFGIGITKFAMNFVKEKVRL